MTGNSFTQQCSSGIPLFAFRNVSRVFTKSGGLFGEAQTFSAVKNVSLSVNKGETLGLVGESGCGKSTLARMAVRLLPPTGGDILLEGISVFSPDEAFVASLPGRVQMVFQDPFSSLNPRMSIGASVGEALTAMGMPTKERNGKVAAMLGMVGLEAETMRRYPHEFSGGQRQRVAIARALVTNPDFVVLDEPTSSLDASVQAQVLALLKDLQDKLRLTYLFISHDLAVISHMSDRVAVMKAGEIVEENDAATLFASPAHPYTKSLLAAAPAYHGIEGEDGGPGKDTPKTGEPKSKKKTHAAP
ncbi:dipeptide transporter; ATP-binding component of ABC superfamily (fragment) [uncultured delta proteobacterium]|uniref:Dipeptide transporter ATP-binding component of ABC superfamily n=1 Tax=uncultured delta proteobacterium TaxID=34034 RepID=A0A212JZX6_9DELT